MKAGGKPPRDHRRNYSSSSCVSSIMDTFSTFASRVIPGPPLLFAGSPPPRRSDRVDGSEQEMTQRRSRYRSGSGKQHRKRSSNKDRRRSGHRDRRGRLSEGSAPESVTDNASNIQSEVLSWSTDDVCEWIQNIGLAPDDKTGASLKLYLDTFRRHNIDGKMLLHLNDQTLEEELGMMKKLDRLRVLYSIEELLGTDVAAVTPATPSRGERMNSGFPRSMSSLSLSSDNYEDSTSTASAPAWSTPAGPTHEHVKLFKDGDFFDVQHLKDGEFGSVFRAKLRSREVVVNERGEAEAILVGRDVVVKVPKHERGTEWNELDAFVNIAPHKNVLPLLGICIDFRQMKRGVSFVMEYVPKGSLKDILVGDSSEDMLDILKLDTDVGLLTTVLHIARGLAHLHAHRIVHRDIALRNVLVTNSGRAMVCDFGLSRRVGDDPKSFYRVSDTSLLPLRWMAAESMSGTFTRKSDVWMFGVTIWELLVGGARIPYEEIRNVPEVISGVATGTLHLSLPEQHMGHSLPAGLAPLIESCWSPNPDDRPTMREISYRLEYMLAVQTGAPLPEPPSPERFPSTPTGGRGANGDDRDGVDNGSLETAAAPHSASLLVSSSSQGGRIEEVKADSDAVSPQKREITPYDFPVDVPVRVQSDPTAIAAQQAAVSSSRDAHQPSPTNHPTALFDELDMKESEPVPMRRAESVPMPSSVVRSVSLKLDGGFEEFRPVGSHPLKSGGGLWGRFGSGSSSRSIPTSSTTSSTTACERKELEASSSSLDDKSNVSVADGVSPPSSSGASTSVVSQANRGILSGLNITFELDHRAHPRSS